MLTTVVTVSVIDTLLSRIELRLWFCGLAATLFVLDWSITSKLSRFELSENALTLTDRLCGDTPDLNCMIWTGLPILAGAGEIYLRLLFSGVRHGQRIACLLSLTAAVAGCVIGVFNLHGMLSKRTHE